MPAVNPDRRDCATDGVEEEEVPKRDLMVSKVANLGGRKRVQEKMVVSQSEWMLRTGLRLWRKSPTDCE